MGMVMFCCSMGLACNEQQLNVVQSYSMARNAEIIVWLLLAPPLSHANM